jgi:hypothetical protein
MSGISDIVSATGDNRIQYIRFLRGDSSSEGGREKVYDTIPKDQWGDKNTAFDLAERVHSQVKRKWGNGFITPHFAPMDESPTGFGVKVHYTTFIDSTGQKHTPNPSIKEVRSELPDKGSGKASKENYHAHRQNIPIRVVEIQESTTNCDGEHNSFCQDITDYEDIPGGIPCDYGDQSASLCAPFNDNTYGPGWIGSGHTATEGDTVDLLNDIFGTVQHVKDTFNNDIDYCYIEDDQTDDDPSPYVADKNASGVPLTRSSAPFQIPP